jgi:hypothetical protein
MAIDRSSQNWPDTVEVSDETKPCTRCAKHTDVLAIFPGGICLECYAAKEGKQPLTRSDFNGMMRAFSGKRK